MQIEIIKDSNIVQNSNGTLEILDANGKKINTNVSDIVDASSTLDNGPRDITDTELTSLNFSVSITDSEGSEITDTELLDSVKSGEAIALDVTFESTHTGGNQNCVNYTSDSMAEDCKTWLYPFKKPLIKNHDMSQEPIGRTVDALHRGSEFVDDRDTIDVTYRVSDSDAMAKFADGRYKTMSIGATAGEIMCNVCGKHILKDNKFKFCGHWKGESYADKTATWTATKLTYKEGSVVNNPADSFAQVKRIKVIKRKEKDGQAMDNQQDDVLETLADMDNIVDNQVEDSNTDGANDEPKVDPTQQDNSLVDDSEGDKLTEALNKIADLEANVTTLTEEKKALEDSISEKDEKIKSLEDSLEVKDQDTLSLKDQSTRLAKLNKSLLIDNLKLVSPSIEDSEIEGKSAKELFDMIKAEKDPARKVGEPLKNPGIAIKDNNTIIEDTQQDTKQSEKTMRNIDDEISSVLFR